MIYGYTAASSCSVDHDHVSIYQSSFGS